MHEYLEVVKYFEMNALLWMLLDMQISQQKCIYFPQNTFSPFIQVAAHSSKTHLCRESTNSHRYELQGAAQG
jgi:hypothetical protein